MQLNIQTSEEKKSWQIDTTYLIEQEFQDYFKVLLHKQDENCYSVPEWDSHFNWGHHQFTLRQLQALLKGHNQLAKIVPEIKSFSWLEIKNLV